MGIFHSTAIALAVLLLVIGLGTAVSLLFFWMVRYLNEEEKLENQKETRKTCLERLGILTLISGSKRLIAIEEGSHPGAAKLIWYGVGAQKVEAEVPKTLFHFEIRENHTAPTVEFTFDEYWLQEKPWWGGIKKWDDELTKKRPLGAWISGESVNKVIVRVSSTYEPFSLKGISTAVFEEQKSGQEEKPHAENQAQHQAGKKEEKS